MIAWQRASKFPFITIAIFFSSPRPRKVPKKLKYFSNFQLVHFFHFRIIHLVRFENLSICISFADYDYRYPFLYFCAYLRKMYHIFFEKEHTHFKEKKNKIKNLRRHSLKPVGFHLSSLKMHLLLAEIPFWSV